MHPISQGPLRLKASNLIYRKSALEVLCCILLYAIFNCLEEYTTLLRSLTHDFACVMLCFPEYNLN